MAGVGPDDQRGVGLAEEVATGERGAERGQRDPQGSLDFLRGRARPATPLIVEFIRIHHGHREAGGVVWGVEPICTMLSEDGHRHKSRRVGSVL